MFVLVNVFTRGGREGRGGGSWLVPCLWLPVTGKFLCDFRILREFGGRKSLF